MGTGCGLNGLLVMPIFDPKIFNPDRPRASQIASHASPSHSHPNSKGFEFGVCKFYTETCMPLVTEKFDNCTRDIINPC